VFGEPITGLEDGWVFRGVPFAAPPTGDRRWRAPSPPEPWSGAREATRFAPACMQTDAITQWYADVAEGVGAPRSVAPTPNGVSEDCLYLNIWTPDLDPQAPAPVMVYIHGGSYTAGWSYEPNYHGEAFAERGGVLVSIAYRLGAFGYLAPDDDGAALNAGLLDQVAALEWVRDNIAAFGGDPERVTVFGESAGAAAVGALLVSPSARGLFQGAIHQSGGFEFTAERTPGSASEAFNALAAALGESPMEASAEAVLDAAGDVLGAYDYGPVPGPPELPSSPRDALEAGEVARVPLIIGTNQDEWLMYMDEATPGNDLSRWRERVGSETLSALIAEAGSIPAALDRLETAEWMRCPGRALARAASRAGAPVYLYRLERVREGAATLGAYHGAELPYVFDAHDAWLPTSREDEQLGQAMNAAWARFAAEGDPNGPGLPDWPEFARSGEVLVWDDMPAGEPPLDRRVCITLGWETP